MLNIKYLTSQDGKAIAVVIPIDIWRQLLPNDDDSEVNFVENFRQSKHEAMTGKTIPIATIFEEFAEEDRELAEAGMVDYAEQLQHEDQ